MSLVDQVIEKYLEREKRAKSLETKAKEVRRGDEINALPLDKFHDLPRADQEFAEELWAARVLEANVRRDQKRRERLLRELDLAM